MSDFFSSTTGTIVVLLISLAVFSLMLLSLRQKKALSTLSITYASVCIALAFILSYVKLFKMPYGGSVTAMSMFFIVIVGYWFGARMGIMAGIICGLLGLAFDGYVIHPVQLLLDYPIAFGALGISGFFSQKKYGLYIGYIAGTLGRLFCSFLSGVIFFSAYAPEGMNLMWYSFIYNAAYMAPEMIITMAVVSIPAVKTALNRQKARLSTT